MCPWVQEAALKRNIDVNDVKKMNQLMKEQMGIAEMLAVPEADRGAGHPAKQVPRFGNDLGFSPRGIQVRRPICTRSARRSPCLVMSYVRCRD